MSRMEDEPDEKKPQMNTDEHRFADEDEQNEYETRSQTPEK
jgi:hypothetical protein